MNLVNSGFCRHFEVFFAGAKAVRALGHLVDLFDLYDALVGNFALHNLLALAFTAAYLQ